MSKNAVLSVSPMGFPWQTQDPFLFCVHHLDFYPEGDEKMGPKASVSGRNIGSDFSNKDGWSMYHGQDVPGFPMHPHRGFETITIARNGFIDHSDSLGAAARFGNGDVQWMTAGSGVVHSEMFPLVNKDKENPTELFQIWLNLPRKSKMVDPYFTMFWKNTVPRKTIEDTEGRRIELVAIAGAVEGLEPPTPPPNSWASDPKADIAIWTLKLDEGAKWTIPAGPEGANRTVYFFVGESLSVDGQKLSKGQLAKVDPTQEIVIENGAALGEVLILQGRPIGEPVVQHGPFVMNEPQEIRQAMIDYHQTGFGGWPWPSYGPVHPREQERFARHPDGRVENAE
jgi:redox-sensitive bicupin YhaK (pirin superfamily)